VACASYCSDIVLFLRHDFGFVQRDKINSIHTLTFVLHSHILMHNDKRSTHVDQVQKRHIFPLIYCLELFN